MATSPVLSEMEQHPNNQFEQNHRQEPRKTRILAMLLLGAGLLTAGMLALFFLLKGQSSTKWQERLIIPASVNYPVPELTLHDLSGNQVSLNEYVGKVLLVNNWATWCPPCKEEMPEFESYYQKHKQQDFLSIAIEAGDPPEQVARYVNQTGLTFRIWLDPGNEALSVFRNQSLPNSYVIDRAGDVRLAWSGAIKVETLEEYVTPLLGE